MNLLVLDLDGTITKSDNLIRFTNYMICKEKRFKFLLFFPLLILLKMRLISNVRFKIYYSTLIFKNLDVEYLGNCAKKFVYSETFQHDINHEVVKFMNAQKNSSKVILSSNYNFISENVAKLLNIETSISVNLETIHGKFTGLIKGQIPYGKNKINAFSNFIKDNNYKRTIGLGDSKSDLPLLQYLNEGYLVKFHRRSNKTIITRIQS